MYEEQYLSSKKSYTKCDFIKGAKKPQKVAWLVQLKRVFFTSFKRVVAAVVVVKLQTAKKSKTLIWATIDI